MGGRHRGGTTAALRRDLRRIAGSGTINADVTVPPNELWLIKSVGVHYVASAIAGNRLIRVELVIGGTAQEGVETLVPVVANDDTLLMFGPGVPESTQQGGQASEGTIYVPLTETIANAGEIIRCRAATGGDAGDAITSNVNVEVQFL